MGSGLFGSVFAREMSDIGKKCLIIEKRSHIGGNVFTENIEGINVHKYGPHIFHTDDIRIWNYVNRFADFNHFSYRPRVNYKGKIFSFPINMMTLYQLWGVKTPAQARKRIDQVRIKIAEPNNLEDWVLSQVGEEIYETFIKGYTKKQWQRDPKELPISIIKRIPIRFTYDDNYYFDKYQGIPIGGYTRMMKKILEGIEVKTGIDFFDDRKHWKKLSKKILFTGKIDEFFDYKFGALEYISLDFDMKFLHTSDFQGVAGMNYTDENVPYTRSIEHKYFEFGNQKHTVVTWEYPKTATKSDIPYYPINNRINKERFNKYKELSKKDSVIFGGRLAEYKYYDMHQVIDAALKTVKKEMNPSNE